MKCVLKYLKENSQLDSLLPPTEGKWFLTPFCVAKPRYDISNRQECDGRLPFMPHNSFQMRSGYMNWALLTCVPRTGKIIGTIGSCMSFDACESKSDTISVPFPSFGIFGAVFFEILYFILIYLFLVKWLIISLLEKKSSGLLFQFQLFQLIFWWLRFFIFSIFIILYIYYNYIYIK